MRLPFVLFHLCSFLLLLDGFSILGVTRYRARVMYDGTFFKGWQDVAADVRTVQKTLSDHLSTRFNVPIKIVGASRTDAGVHARGQAIHFDVPTEVAFNFLSFENQINKLLPHEIRLYNVSIAPVFPYTESDGKQSYRKWHAISSARRKHYSYTFTMNKIQDPIRRSFVASLSEEVDIPTLKAALRVFEGQHDFCAFTNAVKPNIKNSVPISTKKCIESINIHGANEHNEYCIDIFLHSALYKMLRNIVWSAITVSCKDSKYHIDDIKKLLVEGKSRVDNWALTAPARGLCLERVYYDDY